MTQPLFSIGGIASGLDTQGILQQLLELERQPIVRFQQQQADLRRVDDAWKQVNTRLSSLRSAVDELRRPDSFARRVTASSSHPDAVAVSVTGSPPPGMTSFSVQRLASAHQLAAGGSFASADTKVGAGTITLTREDGTEIGTVTTDESTTLRQLAERITGQGAGVAAQVVKTGEGAHRLVLTATATGEAARFSVAADGSLAGFADIETLRTGEDAHLRLGTLDVYRSGNTVNDLIDGVSLTLRQTTGDTPVTVTTQRDVDGAVAGVRKLVDAVNGVLNLARDLSAYNAETRASGPLQGDATLRRLVTDLRTAVSAAVPGLEPGSNHGSAVGLALDRNGALTLDETRLRQALTDDFDAVGRLFARSGATEDPRAQFVSASDATQGGTYGINMTRAATIAAVTGSSFTPPSGDPKTFTITVDGKTVSVQIDEDTDLSTAVDKIRQALAAAGVTSLKVDAQDDALRFESTRYGSPGTFTVAGTGDVALDGEHAGQDVEGTIGGLAATGRGQTLTGAEGAVQGLTLLVSATSAQVADAGGTLDLGGVTVIHGIGGALDKTLRTFEGSGGAVVRARDALSSRIRQFDQRIADFETRIESREVTLRRQFTALESAMGRLQSQGAWMASQLAAMAAPRQ